MPRPSEERTPLEMLAEVERGVLGLKRALEGSPGLYEMNMAHTMSEELNKATGRLTRRIGKVLRKEIFERGNQNDNVEHHRKPNLRINLVKKQSK
ncbi:TPA: hypothetical protein U1366_002259 [Streptococcus suis]|uniref:hypothetical protein n=1 Tax=Streptococcus suis TaxID=1307 RepID=UPI0005CEA9C3|nr:hypothetical protein [Streptococcus suis]CYV17625.1 Uncharacterised protein [Streptococcus suis]HEM5301503.1 hypothetical protein [Streptococcus suis]